MQWNVKSTHKQYVTLLCDHCDVGKTQLQHGVGCILEITHYSSPLVMPPLQYHAGDFGPP